MEMKTETLHIRAVRTTPVSFDSWKREVEAISEIITGAEVSISYEVMPNLFDGVELEDDDDIDEYWLAKQIHNKNFHGFYVHLSEHEWKSLGIRGSLWGQNRTINDKFFCYGRWYEDSSYQNSEYFPVGLKHLAEQTIGLAHEIRHGISPILNIEDTTHYHFYGFDVPDGGDRYARTPTPKQAFKYLPWYKLPKIDNPARDYTQLERLKNLLKKAESLYKKKINDIDIIARTLWGEARGDDRESMKAVACVIRNRVQESGWPDDYREVCLQGHQFSCWNDNDPNRAKVEAVTEENEVFKVAKEVAKEVYEGAQDITSDADHYHTKDIDKLPPWRDKEKITAMIGSHVFYNLRQ